MVQPEGKHLGVGGDLSLSFQDGFGPVLGLEEDGAREGGFGEGLGLGQGFDGGGGEGADVVGWHHCFGGFAVWEGLEGVV